jgi:hypothetical protein
MIMQFTEIFGIPRWLTRIWLYNLWVINLAVGLMGISDSGFSRASVSIDLFWFTRISPA